MAANLPKVNGKISKIREYLGHGKDDGDTPLNLVSRHALSYANFWFRTVHQYHSYVRKWPLNNDGLFTSLARVSEVV